MPDDYRAAAKKYKPKRVRILFVAESPPAPKKGERRRYFYFANVDKHDWLWRGLMKALFRDFSGDIELERTQKTKWLSRFQRDGYWLIDAVKQPIRKIDASGKKISQAALRKKIEGCANEFIAEARAVKPQQVVLISKPVHMALFRPCREAGLPVVNKTPLYLPMTGRQKEFQAQFQELVESGRLKVTGWPQ